MESQEPRRSLGIGSLPEFLHAEAAGGVVLVVAAVVAMVAANTGLGDRFASMWSTRIGLSVGSFELAMDLRHWINDGLMAVFFLVVGLEIKRELVEGELSKLRIALMPILAAVGGMVVPAIVYFALNSGSAQAHGWGVPMATDVALALGVVAVLGPRVPPAAKIFVLALAIVDDIGAIMVIAVFYSGGVSWWYLCGAAVCLLLVVVARRSGVTATPVFLGLGIALWICLHEAGVHATLAGVAMGLLAPTSPHIAPESVDAQELGDVATVGSARQTARLARSSVSTVAWLEHVLHPWSSMFVVPVFALANTGIVISGDAVGSLASSRVTWGVVAGLVIGKPVGIVSAMALARMFNIGELPEAMSWRVVAGIGCLAGIGFTVSLFVAELAVEDPNVVATAKLAVLIASVVAAVMGVAVLGVGQRSSATDARVGEQLVT